MAIIYSYPTVLPTSDDLVLGTDVNKSGNPTKNFTIGSIIDLVTAGAAGLGATIKLTTPPGDASDPITPFANQPIINLSNLSGTGNVSGFASFSTAGGVDITGTIGSGFTAFTSTIITGTLQTAAQPNITSVGTLTSLSVNTSVTGTAVVTTLVAPGDNLKIASTKAIVDYIATKPATETLAEALVAGNVTGGTSIVVSAGDNITFTDTSKALFGSGQDLEVNNDGIDSFVTDLSTGDLRLRSDDAVKIQASTGGNTLATFTKSGSVDLYFANAKKFETLTGGAKVTGAFEATTSGTFASLVNAGTYTAGNGVGSAGQILSSTGTGTNWVTEVPLYNWSLEGTAIPSGTAVTVTDGNNITTTWDAATFDLTIAASGDGVTGTGAANQVTYWTGAQTVAGDTGMTYDATANDLTVANIIKADTFTTTAGTATWVTTVLDGFTSITSALFIGNAAASLTPPIPPFAVGSADNVEFQGNASTANQLSFGGTIGTSGDVTTVTAPTYTSGGSQLIATTIADTIVTGKVLTNLPTPTSSSILNTDTILAAMAKLQGQITATSGLTYEGLWNATTDSPALSGTTPANGVFYIVDVAGNTSLSGITDWLVGDWAIYVSNGSATDGWQKLDMTSDITGTGSANSYAMWTGPNSVATGLISQNAGANLVTIGNSGGLLVEGSTTLGDAITDTVTVTGDVTLNENLILEKGLSVGSSSTDPYGVSGQVLTSGGGVGVANSWTTPTIGTYTDVNAGDGLLASGSGTSADPRIISPNYTGTANIILSATSEAAAIGAADSIIYVDQSLAAKTVKYGQVQSLPFDNYNGWIISDGVDTTPVTTGNTAIFSGGTYITTSESLRTLTINHDATTRTDTTSADAPAFAGTFEAVSSVTTNGTGHVTAIDVATVTIPANPDMTAASAAAGGAHGLVVPSAAGDQLKFLRADATWVIPTNTEGVTAVTATAPISSSGGDTPNITHDTSGVTAGTYDSVTVDAKGHVTGGSNPGGSGGGIFSGDQLLTFPAPSVGDLAFTLNRATTGTLIFDVWFTSETSIATSVAKKYTVAHANNATPVYNKIIDTGPAGSNDFTVSFVNAGSGLSVECYIVAGSIAQNIGYTVQVGHDSTNALTFTAAS